MTFVRGTIAQTLLWQSPAFATYGYTHHPNEVRDEPAPEQVFGDQFIVLDAAHDRTEFSAEEQTALAVFLDTAADNAIAVMVVFCGRDLSSTGGLWRSTVRESALGPRRGGWHQLGLEALSYLVLTATLVYLEFAPDLDWDHANYLG